MTLEHALRLLAMLTDTVTAQQQQINALTAEVQRLTPPPAQEELSWPTPSAS